MGNAKEIIVRPIRARDAKAVCKKFHYSGKVMASAQIHFGVFYKGKCEGVMQFGAPIDKKRMAKNLGVGFNNFLELTRLAFSDFLPRNSESRAISVAVRIIRKTYPWIDLILSFSDACQCGDGAIYRASGFRLIGIKRNNSLLRLSDNALRYVRKFIPGATHIISKKSLDDHSDNGKYLSSTIRELGCSPLEGYQLKYVICLNESLWDNFNYIPFSKIKEIGASMYKGVRIEHESNASDYQSEEGGAVPTDALQFKEAKLHGENGQ